MSAVQKRLKIEYLAKNGLHRPIEYVGVEIVAVPSVQKKIEERKLGKKRYA
jgi:hypothetical protein